MPFRVYQTQKRESIFHLCIGWLLAAACPSAAWVLRRTSSPTNICTSRRMVVILFSSLDSDNMKYEEASKWQLGNLFNVPTGNKSNDPLEGKTLHELEEYFSRRGESINNKSGFGDHARSDDEQNGGGGVWLDPDLYISSRYCMNPDGSLELPESDTMPMIDYERVLQTIAQPSPKVSERYYMKGKNPSIEEVWEILQNQDLAIVKNQTSEELHKKVFENEEGYFQNSQVFLQSLTDESKAEQARALRHRARYRERQEAAIQTLEEQMKAFEDELKVKEYSGPKCSKCSSVLFQEELLARNGPLCQICRAQMLREKSRMERKSLAPFPIPRRRDGGRQNGPTVRAPQLRSASTSFEPDEDLDRDLQTPGTMRDKSQQRSAGTNNFGSPVVQPTPAKIEQGDENLWVEVEDPDTGEIFYWNSETEEMKWEI